MGLTWALRLTWAVAVGAHSACLNATPLRAQNIHLPNEGHLSILRALELVRSMVAGLVATMSQEERAQRRKSADPGRDLPLAS